MTPTLASLGLAAVVGIASGADASIWGMYKDAVHEGFTWSRFSRSIVIGLCCAVGIQLALDLNLSLPSTKLLLFGLAYAAERALVETWKTFLRDENQSKYTIPMQFAIRGRPVRSRAIRFGFGVLYLGVLGIILIAFSRWSMERETGRAAALLGFLAGLVIAIGGAWKDAPIEGFEPLKFFRSPVLTTAFALLLFPFAGSPLLAALAAIGYERAASENYKTFFFPKRPRGKFADKPVTHAQMLRARRRFVPAYVAIRIALVWLAVQTYAGAAECLSSSHRCGPPSARFVDQGR